MTAIVGILCKDGVVVGTDSSATFAQYVGAGRQSNTIEQPCDKLHVIADSVVVAGTGAVGLGQRFCAIVESLWKSQSFEKAGKNVSLELSRVMIENMAYTHLKLGGQYGALVAFPANAGLHLCEFGDADFQPEFMTEGLWYCSMGSAQYITDPFLALMREWFWHNGLPSLRDGEFAVTWTLDHAINVNPGGVNGPVQIATLMHSTDGTPVVKRLDEHELLEHRQAIEGAKQRLRDFPSPRTSPDARDIPDVPKP